MVKATILDTSLAATVTLRVGVVAFCLVQSAWLTGCWFPISSAGVWIPEYWSVWPGCGVHAVYMMTLARQKVEIGSNHAAGLGPRHARAQSLSHNVGNTKSLKARHVQPGGQNKTDQSPRVPPDAHLSPCRARMWHGQTAKDNALFPSGFASRAPVNRDTTHLRESDALCKSPAQNPHNACFRNRGPEAKGSIPPRGPLG